MKKWLVTRRKKRKSRRKVPGMVKMLLVVRRFHMEWKTLPRANQVRNGSEPQMERIMS